MLSITSSIRIPDSELEISYARSSGPGGQNVNKVNSKAVLRWNIRSSTCLTEIERERILARLAFRLTRDGAVIIASDRFRDQARNREDCLEKLAKLILSALAVPKARKKTAPTFGSKKRTQESKRRQALKKSLRRNPMRFE